MNAKTLLSAATISLLNIGAGYAQITELHTGDILKHGDMLQSRNGKFVFAAHTGTGGGQFCSYPAQNGKIKSRLPFSCIGNTKQGLVRLELWNDGNLVVLNEKNEASWTSSTTPEGDLRFKDISMKPVKMIVGDDGIIGLYSNSGERVWPHKK